MQRREQQRRTAGGGGGGNSYLGGGVSGYASVPRFEAPDMSAAQATRISQNSTPTPARGPAFKGSGMKLGSKKTKQAELLDALGGEAPISSPAESAAPSHMTREQPPIVQKVSGRGSLPEVEASS